MDWLTALDKFGTTSAVLIGVALACRWLAENVAKPVIAGFQEYLHTTGAAQARTAQAVEEIKTSLPTLCKADCPDAANCDNFKPRQKAK